MTPQTLENPVDHTPQVPADDRALRLLEHADLPAARKEAVLGVVARVQADARAAGQELQAEFGREHVALIVGCNQFLRVWRAGPEPGAIELLVDPADKDRLAAAGFALRPPEGQVFRLFGWVRLDADAGPKEAVEAAASAALGKALRTAKK